jgi:hypothetical protein
MNRITRILGILAGVGGALLGILATGSAALAYEVPPGGGGGGPGSPPVQLIANGGMAGWQIALIALGAALAASIIAVLADRSWLARRHRSAASA